MNGKIKILIIISLMLVLAYATYYFADISHADKTAIDLLNGTDNVSVVEASNGLFVDGFGNDTAVIFYPGAKVEYTSYLPLFVELADRGVDCYLVEMPLNFAFLAQDSADSIIRSTNYSHYFLAGHSLGGLSASSYSANSNRTDGTILLAAYPTEKIANPVLSIYGSCDDVLNMESHNKSKHLMDNLTEYVIEGGNHAQFAHYGLQDGDGAAKISPEDQQNQTSMIILEFIGNVTAS